MKLPLIVFVTYLFMLSANETYYSQRVAMGVVGLAVEGRELH
jgi:hypothetical protein